MFYEVIHDYKTHGNRNVHEVVLETENKELAEQRYNHLKSHGYDVRLNELTKKRK